MSLKPKILVIDDEPSIRDFVKSVLEDRYEVLSASCGLDGVRIARSEHPSLILLDILMPGDDGIACLQELRIWPETAKLPVLMLTALNASEMRVKAFNQGADDFIAKPFQPEELIARIESKLQRHSQLTNVSALVLRLGDVVLDLASLRVTIADKEVNVGPVEFKILSLLMRHQGRLTRREELEKFVWSNQTASERILDAHIFALRKKLQASTLLLQTVYGTGYTLSVKTDAK